MKKGDSLIEVILANTVFGFLAVAVVAIMNHGLQYSQNTLELTMARNEMDAQAESLRFLHDAYSSEKKNANSVYADIWDAIANKAYSPKELQEKYPSFYENFTRSDITCANMYDFSNEGAGVITQNSFVLNTHSLDTSSVSDSALYNTLNESPIYPRLIYGAGSSEALSDTYYDASVGGIVRHYNNNLYSAEGLWVTAVRSTIGQQCTNNDGEKVFHPDYYDFYIRSCWDNLSKNVDNTMATTIRLSNPNSVFVTNSSIVTFDNLEWTKYDNIKNHTYCATNPRYNWCTEPTDHSKNTDISGTTISFTGYNISPMNEGVYYDLEAGEGFTITDEINGNNIIPHPGGFLTVSIGDLSAKINTSNTVFYLKGKQVCKDASRKTCSTKRKFNLSMSKDTSGKYSLVVDGEEWYLGDQSDAVIGETRIDFNFQHGGHACSQLSKATISNIEMVYLGGGDEENHNCERIDVP